MNIKTYFLDYNFKNSSHLYCEKALKNHIPQDLTLSEKIKLNKKKVQKFIKSKQLIILYQTHSNKVISIDNIKSCGHEPCADGVVTNLANTALAIQTADCAPILLYCRKTNIIGAAHCGWKGVENMIVSNVIEKMHELGASDLFAIIGPAIAQKSYQVSEEFYKSFCIHDSDFGKFFIRDIQNKIYFDLPGAAQYQLQKCGLFNIEVKNNDTFTQRNYPSYRRAKKEKGNIYERMLSCIINYQK